MQLLMYLVIILLTAGIALFWLKGVHNIVNDRFKEQIDKCSKDEHFKKYIITSLILIKFLLLFLVIFCVAIMVSVSIDLTDIKSTNKDVTTEVITE